MLPCSTFAPIVELLPQALVEVDLLMAKWPVFGETAAHIAQFSTGSMRGQGAGATSSSSVRMIVASISVASVIPRSVSFIRTADTLYGWHDPCGVIAPLPEYTRQMNVGP
jgi:hypothetical protein